MTKEEILNYFKDINQMYNNATMLDSLSHMLDEYTPEEKPKLINEMVAEAIDTYMVEKTDAPDCVVVNNAAWEALKKYTHKYALPPNMNSNPNAGDGYISIMGARIRLMDDGKADPAIWVTGDWYFYDGSKLCEC